MNAELGSRPGAGSSAPVGRGEPAIVARNVRQSFGTPGDPDYVVALEDSSLTIERGELVCLIGPSGCGKSSLLNIIGGLARPTAGEVLVDGQPVTGPLPKNVAFVFQESTLFPWLDVMGNIRVGLEFQGVDRSERDDRAVEALTTVGMLDFRHHLPRQLSGGMKQRVQLARALSLQTDIILMDEPFAALDEQTRMLLGEELSVMLSRSQRTIVFVTHSLVEAVFLADRVAIFTARPGRIKSVIEVDEPHPRSQAFMTSAKLSALRNDLYEQLYDEVRRTIASSAHASVRS